LWVDQLLIFPADNVHGFDRDVVDLSRNARLPLLRYPGGNFVSGYHWRDGIGPVNNRPMRRNPAWNCPEYNHVGTDEFMAFCETVGCEPMICVNAGSGTAAEAAEWVEYCNGSIETPLGALRAANGHPRPYDVRYWEIGNEIYGGWQVGHCSAAEYAERYYAFVRAMRKVDSNVQFIANGHNAEWHAPLLDAHPELVRSFSLHPLIGMSIPRTSDPANVYLSLMAYPDWYRDWLLELAGQMKSAGVEPKLAITELQIFTNKRELPNNSSLSEAVYMARYFHTAVRLGDLVEMITHSAMTNHGGGLRKERGVVYAQPSWWATHLYGTMSGTIPLAIDVQTPTYNVEQDKMPSVEGAPYIDAIALMNGSGDLISLMVINTHPKEKIPVQIDVAGWDMPSMLSGRRITGPSFMSRNTLEEPDMVSIHEIHEPASTRDDRLQYTAPPHSVTELVFSK
jgi:alpha-N-arabinofuranosidase